MAAANPTAVATSASEMPGATTARLADPIWPIPWKEFMIPQTVPKSPINGVVLTRMTQMVPFLATTGNTTPFIGLFGTVWGIMDAFMQISEAQSTALNAVAPGIAEALIATALGLFAAIPAVIAYNHFLQRIKELVNEMEDFSIEFLNITERLYGV